LTLDSLCPTPHAKIGCMKNQNQSINIENQTIIFEPVTPHPEPVVIGELLADIETVIKRHVVLTDNAATALAVWVLHTYVYEVRDTVAYVAIESPEKRCGKTTLLSVLAAMANKPLIASNVTVGALFRAIDTCRPTLFIDEADTFLAGSSTMRGIINSGNTWRTAYVLRLSKSKWKPTPNGNQNGDSELPENTDSGLKRYSCWCPKVIAMIGKVPDTIADRSIVVSMARKLTTETRAPLAELQPATIKAKCARFALDEKQKIARHEKIRGRDLNDRAADTFDPLYVIARLAGQEWEQKLHAAALALSPGAGSKSPAAELLLNIHIIFILSGKPKIFTRDLIDALQDERWGIGSLAVKYSGIDEYGISQVLRPYGIKPTTFRIGKEVNKGYVGEDFEDALRRYVPKADVDARVQETLRKAELWVEAKKEREAEEESRWQVTPTGKQSISGNL
jgi:putative DNA primase/helicase